MILLKNPGDSLSYRVYVDDIGTATLVSAIAAGDGLATGSQAVDNTTTPKSAVVTLTGGTHGMIYQDTIAFVLSTGGTLDRTVTTRVSASI